MTHTQSAITFQHLWSGSFLDGTLTLSKDPTNDTIIYFTLTDSIDLEFQGYMPTPPQLSSSPSDAIDSILKVINEQYCIFQLHLYNAHVAEGKSVH